MKRLRKVIRIDEEKCNGCGLCVPACAEGAIEIVNGKARLASEVHCDGLGNCLGQCPQDAITIEEREAEDFDAKATEKHVERKKAAVTAVAGPAHGGCPGARMMSLGRRPAATASAAAGEIPSQLANWPVKMVLAPVSAPWYAGATLLIAADCAAFANGDFHRRFLAGKPLLTFCPKFGEIEEQKAKLAEILRTNDVRGLEVLYMEVPCCFGLAWLAQSAVEESGKSIPVRLTKISIRGDVLEEELAPIAK